MPQIVSIQPIVPQGPSPGAPGQKEQSQKEQSQTEQSKFSPHLENALSSKKSPQHGADDKHLEKTSRSNNPNDPNEPKVSTDGESQSSKRTTSEVIEAAGEEELGDSLRQNPASTHLAYFLEGTPRTIPAASILLNSHQFESIVNLLQSASAVLDTLSNNANTPPGLAAIQPELSSMNTEESEGLNFIKPGVVSKQNALLSQLQQIIDSANEIGSVSITKATNTSSPHGLRNSIHGLSTALFAVTSEPVTASPSNETFHENQQGEEFSQQTNSSTLQSTTLGATEPTNTISQVSAAVQTANAQPVAESPKPIMLPSGAIVHEDEVIRQLSERFQISSRHMDSRINTKLHTVELGELKIDLTVKEGSIRANVVAQSQHALEILEKNIQKLKNMLEQQGFTIEQISLTAESESVGDFDLFDRQLFSKNDSTPAAATNRREGEAIFYQQTRQLLIRRQTPASM